MARLFGAKDEKAAARARALARALGAPRATLPLYVDGADLVALAIARHVVRHDEILCAVHRVRARPSSSEARDGDAPVRALVLTDARFVVVTVPAEGDLSSRTASSGDLATLPTRLASTLRALADAPRGVRLASLVRAHHETRKRADVEAARMVVQLLVAEREPCGVITALFIERRSAAASRGADDDVARPPRDAVQEALTALAHDDERGARLVALADALALGHDERHFLVDSARALPLGARFSLALHRSACALVDDKAPFFERARAHLELSAHALVAEDHALARDEAERALATLPDAVDDDLLDASEDGAGALRARALLALAHTEPEPTVALARRIVRAMPFDVAAWELLERAAHGDDDLAARARAARTLVEGRVAHGPDDDPLAKTRVAALSPDDRRALLGPRSDADPLFFMQSLVAEIDAPDARALTDFCERATSERAPFVVRAANEAATVLGLPMPAVFVSRGARAIGVRAHQGTTPVLLVGMAHLVDGEAPLDALSARFIVTSELAHLAFGHTRFTAEDVWNGLVNKGKASLGLVLTVLPSVGGIGQVKKVLSVVAQASTLAKPTQKADTAGGLSPPSEAFVRAHRSMQRRADRVGLSVVDDIHAAVRGLAAVEPRYDAELAVAEREGLARALLRRDGDGRVVHKELAIRVADLLSRFVDDQHRTIARRTRVAHDDKNAEK